MHTNFRYLYRKIIEQLNVFDPYGQLREKSQAEGNLNATLDLMEELGHVVIYQDVVSVSKALPQYLTYFDEARTGGCQCRKLTDKQDALTAFCLAWQWEKAIIKSKKPERKHQAIAQRDFYLEWTMWIVGDKQNEIRLKDCVYEALDQTIQASSMVELLQNELRKHEQTLAA